MSDLTAIITLDGTHLSEEALQLVPFLHDLGVDRIRLVGVWETHNERRGPSTNEDIDRARGVIGAYLEARAITCTTPGLTVEPVFRAGRVADEIIAEEVDCRADLIVIATHGRAGTDRWRLGSVADEVIRRASVPVLVAGPNLHVSLSQFRSHRIAVPLDGLSLAEQAIPAARAVAERTGAKVTLVRVVTFDVSWAVAVVDDVRKVFEETEAAAKQDLERLASEMGWQSVVLRAGYPNNVPNELNRYISNNAIDLVVMTSHSRPTLERWLLDSVTEDMLRGSAPVLLVKPGQIHGSRLFRPLAAATPAS